MSRLSRLGMASALLLAQVGCSSLGSSGGTTSWWGGKKSEPAASLAGQEPGMWDKVKGTISAPFTRQPAQTASQPQKGDVTALATPSPKIEPKTHVAVAKNLESGGKTEAAAEQYERALVADPNNFDALVGLARLRDRQGDFERATALYQRAATRDPLSAMVFNDLGLCLFRQGKRDDSLVALDRAIELQPKKRLYRNNIATVLVDAQRPDKALDHLAAVHSPAVAHYNLGYLLAQSALPYGNSLALKHFHKAIEADPSFAAAQQWVDRLDGTTTAVAQNPTPATGREVTVSAETEVTQRVARRERYAPADALPPESSPTAAEEAERVTVEEAAPPETTPAYRRAPAPAATEEAAPTATGTTTAPGTEATKPSVRRLSRPSRY